MCGSNFESSPESGTRWHEGGAPGIPASENPGRDQARRLEPLLAPDLEGDGVAGERGEAQPRALLPLALDKWFVPVADDSHFAALPPPRVDLAGEGHPDSALPAQLREMLQESPVRGLRLLLDDVVGMDQQTGQTVSFHNGVELVSPNINRVVVQDVEQRVVLGRREGKLQHTSDEKRHQAATPAPLRLETPGAGHRHVVGELEGVIPCEVSIEAARAEAAGAVDPSVLVDLPRSQAEIVMVGEQPPVMVQIVDVDL